MQVITKSRSLNTLKIISVFLFLILDWNGIISLSYQDNEIIIITPLPLGPN